jgi:hypothetical protein
MNILDIQEKIESGEIKLPEGDRLALIFEGQRELMRKYEPIEKARGALTVKPHMHGDLNHRFVQWRIKDVMGERCVEEIMEAMNCLRNKPWKQSEVDTDVDHFKEEIADALHFFVEGCITAGIDSEELFTLYIMKRLINEFRQRTNY